MKVEKSKSEMKGMEHWRQRIDEIDLQLVKLLNERSRCAIEIGKVKKELDIEIYDPRREEEVICHVQAAAQGPLSPAALRRLFERIIDESRRAEREYRDEEDETESSDGSPPNSRLGD